MTEEKVVDSTEIAIDKISDTIEEVVSDLSKPVINEVIDTVVGAGVGDVVGDIDVDDFIEAVIDCVSEEILEEAIIEVRRQLGVVGIKPTTLAIVIKHVMEVVENIPIKGKDQMKCAILIIGDLVNDLEDGNEKTLLINMIDNGSIKDTIELVVDASKGKLKINKVIDVATEGCLGPCLKYIMSSGFK